MALITPRPGVQGSPTANIFNSLRPPARAAFPLCGDYRVGLHLRAGPRLLRQPQAGISGDVVDPLGVDVSAAEDGSAVEGVGPNLAEPGYPGAPEILESLVAASRAVTLGEQVYALAIQTRRL